MAQAPQTNEELFRRTVESLNMRDFDKFAETHSEDVVLHDHDEEFHGVDAAVEHEQALYEAFPDMEYTIEDVLTENDRIAGRWRVTGTHEREFKGIPTSEEMIDIPASARGVSRTSTFSRSSGS